MKTLVKQCISRPLIGVLGFRRARHLGRWLSVTAGADGASDLWHENGEKYLVNCVARQASETDQPVEILEVGSNHGQQTRMIIDCLVRSGIQDCRLHLFEPSTYAYASLCEVLGKANTCIRYHPNHVAVGSRSGTCLLKCFDSLGGGINSIYEKASNHPSWPEPHIEEQPMVSIDDYVKQNKVNKVTLLKSDTEGNEIDVLLGARDCLSSGLIDYIQFEYNSTWIAARKYLLDAFDLLTPLGYYIGKLRPNLVEHFETWDYRLEWFEQANFVAWKTSLFPPFRVTRTKSFLAL